MALLTQSCIISYEVAFWEMRAPNTLRAECWKLTSLVLKTCSTCEKMSAVWLVWPFFCCLSDIYLMQILITSAAVIRTSTLWSLKASNTHL